MRKHEQNHSEQNILDMLLDREVNYNFCAWLDYCLFFQSPVLQAVGTYLAGCQEYSSNKYEPMHYLRCSLLHPRVLQSFIIQFFILRSHAGDFGRATSCTPVFQSNSGGIEKEGVITHLCTQTT